ncbi:helix-turn-helix domain-containing protein [Paracoccus sp. TK19116]|uniref:Helix-turn-helix domain-containing protein n=1 Tax=Paracoccus albicereus TaxID=2922394 RepID=A0ABT1MSH8_9RHOB|nr:helix-turn-helix transcriptional regulator [Paracoccus albicereus]MCQ0971264.1 helix-turn-helix domain-containing protein [Paracoccus albicereus]
MVTTTLDKRDTADVFRQRLQQLHGQSGLSQSGFAQRIGIDRSALSQLLSGRDVRLPRSETLVALSLAFGVSTDWLLGLAAEPAIGTETADRTEIQPSDGHSDPTLMAQWYQETAGQKIRSVPSRLPAMLRNAEVIAFETRGRPEAAERALALTAFQMENAQAPESDIEICMPMQRMQEFASGTGLWTGLPDAIRRDQLVQMADLVEAMYPSFRLHLYDGLKGYLLPQLVFGYQRAAIFAGDMYLVIRARQTIRDLVRGFDGQVRAATVHAHEAGAWLRAL